MCTQIYYTLKEYRTGFGSATGASYWLGNEYVYRLTSSSGTPYRLRVELQGFKTGLWYLAEYSDFSLGPETDRYRLSTGEYEGDAGDAFRYSISTEIVDQTFGTTDDDVGKCSKTSGKVGWWWNGNGCAVSCITGSLGTSAATWANLKDIVNDPVPNGKIQSAVMMISAIAD